MKRLHWFTLFNNFILFAPLAFLIREHKGLNLSEIFILQAVLALSAVLLEVPSGYLADKLGYKRTIIYAQVALILSRLIFLMGFGFQVLLLDVLFLGISNALLSGVLEAYIYEQDKLDFNKTLSKVYNYATYGFIASNILFSGVVYLGEGWLIGATLLANVIALVIAISLPKTNKKHNEETAEEELAQNDTANEEPAPNEAILPNKLIKASFQSIGKDPQFWGLSFFNALIGVGMVVFNMLFIMALIQSGFNAFYYGGVILVYSLAELSVRYTEQIAEYFGKETCMKTLFALAAGLFLAIALIKQMMILLLLGMIVLPVLIMLSILMSEKNNQYIDQMGENAHRVTVLSLFNLTSRAFEALLFFVVAAGFSSISFIYIGISVLFMMAVFIGFGEKAMVLDSEVE